MYSKHIIILLTFTLVKSAKILVVSPAPIISHQLVFRPLIQELIKSEHEVSVVTTDPVYPQGEMPNNLLEINLHNLSYSLLFEAAKNLSKNDQSNLSKMRFGFRSLSNMFKEQIKDKSVQNLLKDVAIRFDLLIIANFVPAGLVFSHIYKTPVIFMSTFGALPGDMNAIGSESHPLLYPTHYHKKIYNLTIWEELYEMYIDVSYKNLHSNQELYDDGMLKSLFGIDTPTLNDLKYNIHMLFLNVHPIWVHNQPVPPNVVYTWGIHKLTKKELPTELKSYLDSSKHGVIYISFGSIFKTSEISQKTLEIFVKVFSQLPYNILWKWDADELPGKTDNIKISKWLPQYDVLTHRNLKLFITHGGLQSTYEAINAGVPLIGIPQFSDQEYNTEKYPYFKIGIKLDNNLLTIKNFEEAINTVLTNYHSYKKNIIKLRTQMHDQPKPALEHVMWRIEYVLRHGGVRHLRAPAANMGWAQYYELEIILLVLGAALVLGSILLVAVHTCLLSTMRFINNEFRSFKLFSNYV